MNPLKLIRQVIRNENFLSLTGNMVFAFLGFANVSLLSRSLSKNDFGEWIIYLSGMAVLEMIRSGLTSTALVRNLAGADDKTERQSLIGASWVLSSIVSLSAIVVIYLALALFHRSIYLKGFDLFFIWYPILSLVVLPITIASSVLQAKKDFGTILLLRTLNMGSFFTFLLLNYLFFHLSVVWILVAHISSYFLAALYALMSGHSGLRYIPYAKKSYVRSQFNFGKYSLGTLLGSNLLKSSDTFILGIMMTTPEVSFYAIPLKLIEVVEIPVRSMVAVAFPSMSQASRQGKNHEVKRIFYNYSGLATWIFIPLVLVLFIMAQPLTRLLGGLQYVDSYVIFQIFLAYALLMPIDRFTGVALDSINRPKLNMIKVFFMASANIIGDILVIHYFKSLELVATVTILNALIGVVVGNIFLHRILGTNIMQIFPAGFTTIRSTLVKFLRNQ